MPFGENLKKILDEMGISTYRFSKMIGKDQSYISKVVNDKVNVSYDMVELCANALGISPGRFFMSKSDEQDYFYLLLQELPQELKDFIISSDSAPYLVLAKNWKEIGIKPDDIRQAVEVLMKATQRVE